MCRYHHRAPVRRGPCLDDADKASVATPIGAVIGRSANQQPSRPPAMDAPHRMEIIARHGPYHIMPQTAGHYWRGATGCNSLTTPQKG